MNQMLKKQKYKNLFPVTYSCKAAVGLCEMMYEFKSQFKYRVELPEKGR